MEDRVRIPEPDLEAQQSEEQSDEGFMREREPQDNQESSGTHARLAHTGEAFRELHEQAREPAKALPVIFIVKNACCNDVVQGLNRPTWRHAEHRCRAHALVRVQPRCNRDAGQSS